MRDPFTWSIPLGRLFGVQVRVHFLFVIFVLVMWLRAAFNDREFTQAGSASTMLVLMTLTFLAVLLHELGHCYAARLVDGDAQEILLWPLGGLANCEVPHTPRAHFITAAGGPAVNLLLCLLTGIVLLMCGFIPSFNPGPTQAWVTELSSWVEPGATFGSAFSRVPNRLEWWQVLVAQFFWVNWFLFLLNTLLVGFPLDGGRMLQATLWWWRGSYRQSMLNAIVAGFIVMFGVAVYALFDKDPLFLCLAGFIYFACKQQWLILESGADDAVFGYDFSQGYTSLERDDTVEPVPPRPKTNFLQRWFQRRAERKRQREQEQTLADEKRMDELLEKIQREGRQALTDEENRFLKRVADRYRNRP